MATKKIDLYKFVATDNQPDTYFHCNPALRGVFHDMEKRWAVASDGVVLAIQPSSYKEPTSPLAILCTHLKGCIVAKNGEFMRGEYPNYRRIIKIEGEEVQILWDDIKARLQEIKDDETLTSSEKKSARVEVFEINGVSYALQAYYARKLLLMPKRMRFTWTGDFAHPLRCENEDLLVLFMLLRNR